MIKSTVKKLFLTVSVLFIAVLNLSCFSMYNDIFDSADSGSYRLSICTTKIAEARLYHINSNLKIEISPWSLLTSNARKSVFADFDRDGNTDIFTMEADAGNISLISYSDGKGNFSDSISIVNGTGSSFNDVETADLDGNGYPDLIIASAGGCYYSLNTGGNDFSSYISAGAVTNFNIITAADFDNDGDTDIFLGSAADGDAELRINRLNESLGLQAMAFPGDPVTLYLYDSAAADFDGDGDIDIIGGDNTAGYVYLYLNDGSAVFTRTWISSAITSPYSIAAADFNGDGRMDAYVATQGTFNYVLINNGNGGFSETAYSVSGLSQSAAAGDFDLDGDMDIVLATNTNIFIYKNDGNGSFTSGPTIGQYVLNTAIGTMFR